MRSYASFFILLVFFANTIGPVPQAQADEFSLPTPGVRVSLSPEFNPPILKGIKVHPNNPFKFDFILDQGDGVQKEQLKTEAIRLIKYFLASLTIPEKDLWVNLSPYEKNRIVPTSFGQTEMGRDLLAEDYMLKQITASLIYPEGETGKRFWKRIYEEAYKKFGTTNIPVNTFNKVWIIPDKAVVYENVKAGTAYVVESKLNVMLEQDYLSLEKHIAVSNNDVNALGSQIVKEIVIPELIKEVNEDKNFTQLRQVYNSLILAAWYKKKIKDSILAQVYEDRKKVAGVAYKNSINSEAIYQRYLQAFKKGAFNYIKEDLDPLTQQPIPRKYFSGGASLYQIDTDMLISENPPANFNTQKPWDVKADMEMSSEVTPRDQLADHALVIRNPEDIPSDLMTRLGNVLENDFDPKMLSNDEGRKNAGMVVLLRQNNGRWEFLLEQRAEGMSSWKNAWVLPGGGQEEKERIKGAAFREFKEEMGPLSKDYEFVGVLSPVDTKKGNPYRMFPVVAVVKDGKDIEFNPNEGEVRDHGWFPLEDVLSKVNTEIDLQDFVIRGDDKTVTVAPANARILLHLAAHVQSIILANMIEEKYGYDAAKAAALAEEIRQPGGHYEKDAEGWDVFISSQAHALVKVSPHGTKRFFDAQGHWLMTVDRYGHVMERLKYDIHGNVGLVEGELPSGYKFKMENGAFRNQTYVTVGDSQFSVLIFNESLEILFKNPEFMPRGEVYITPDAKGVGVVITNMLMRILKDWNLQHPSDQRNMSFVGGTLLEEGVRTLNAVGIKQKGAISDFEWVPNPFERMFDEEGLYFEFRKGEVLHAVRRNIDRKVHYYIPSSEFPFPFQKIESIGNNQFTLQDRVTGSTAVIELREDRALMAQNIDVYHEFKEVSGLGSTTPVVLIVKNSAQAKLMAEHMKSRLLREKEGVYYFPSQGRAARIDAGYVASGLMDNTFAHLMEPIWQKEENYPYAYAANQRNSLIASREGIKVFDKKTGKLEKVIHNPKLYNIHSIEFSPGDPAVILVAAAGSDRIVEINIDTERIVWEWNPWNNGYNENKLGLRIVSPEDRQSVGTGSKELSFKEAEEMMFKNIHLPQGKFFTVVDFNNIRSSGGLEYWQNVTCPNWVGYNPNNPDQILATFYNQGQAVVISRSTGRVIQVVARDLQKPHGLVPFKNGFIVSDTVNGRVLFFDEHFELSDIFDFKSFPFHSNEPLEWLQNTIPITRDLLATVDSKRNNVYVWNPETKEYSIYPFDSNVVAQAVVPADLSMTARTNQAAPEVVYRIKNGGDVPVLNISEIHDLNLSEGELEALKEKIKTGHGTQFVLLREDIIRQAKESRLPLRLTDEMGYIPPEYIDASVEVSKNSSIILENPESDKLSDLPESASVDVNVGGFYRIKIVDKEKGNLYLLVFNPGALKKDKLLLSPLGGGLEYVEPNFPFPITPLRHPQEIKSRVAREHLGEYVQWVHARAGREIDPLRELLEEAVGGKSQVGIFDEIPQEAQGENYVRLRDYLGGDVFLAATEHNHGSFTNAILEIYRNSRIDDFFENLGGYDISTVRKAFINDPHETVTVILNKEDEGALQEIADRAMDVAQQLGAWVHDNQKDFLDELRQRIGIDRERQEAGKGWAICGPASVILSRVFSNIIHLDVGQQFRGQDHIEIDTGIYDHPGQSALIDEHAYVKIYVGTKIIYVDPIFNKWTGAGDSIDFQVFDSEAALADFLRARYIFDFDSNHPAMPNLHRYKGVFRPAIGIVRDALLESMNLNKWPTKWVHVPGESFQLNMGYQQEIEDLIKLFTPPDLAMVTKRDLLDLLEEDEPFVMLSTMLAIEGDDFRDGFQNFDEELGVYVIPDEVMETYSILNTGTMEGKAFNLAGHIGLKLSTVNLIRAGDPEALHVLRHEQGHNKYREMHLDEFPYKSVEQKLIDEIYSDLDSTISVFGRDRLLEDNWFENEAQRLIGYVDHYLGGKNKQKEKIIRKLYHALFIINALFFHNNDAKIMAYILQAKSLDEILGTLPTDKQQLIADDGILPKNHKVLREKWVQFKDFALKVEEPSGPGGIDLTPANMHLQTKVGGDDNAMIGQNGIGIKFHIDPTMLARLQSATGFVPVVVDMEPMADVRRFLSTPSP